MGNSNSAVHSDARDVYVFPNRTRFAQAAARARVPLRGHGPARPALRRVVRAIRTRRSRGADAAWLEAVGAREGGGRIADLEEAVLAAAGVARGELTDAEADRLRAEAGQALARAEDEGEALQIVLSRMAAGAGRGAP